jgi:hypothetical protein
MEHPQFESSPHANVQAASSARRHDKYERLIALTREIPAILTSRADNVMTRTASCAVAALYAHRTRLTNPIKG